MMCVHCSECMSVGVGVCDVCAFDLSVCVYVCECVSVLWVRLCMCMPVWVCLHTSVCIHVFVSCG